MTIDELMIQKLDTLIAATRAASIPVDIALWDAEKIATFLGLSKDHLTRRIVCDQKFPRPICLPTESGVRMTRRWKAAEVIEWAEGRQAKRRAA